jgi:hypothetical protein
MSFWGDVDGWDIDPDGVRSVLQKVAGYLAGADGKGDGGLEKQAMCFGQLIVDAENAALSEPINKALEEYAKATMPELDGMIDKAERCLAGANEALWTYIVGDLWMAAGSKGALRDAFPRDLWNAVPKDVRKRLEGVRGPGDLEKLLESEQNDAVNAHDPPKIKRGPGALRQCQ